MEETAETVYEFSAPLLDGRNVSLREFEGRVLLIVNTASQCGFTPQYAGLENLHRAFKDQGFEVLGFPCNQFGKQEPGTADEIAAFCESNYDVSFPVFDKIDVQRSPNPSALSIPQTEQAGTSRRNRWQHHPMELYKVPREQRGQTGRSVRADPGPEASCT